MTSKKSIPFLVLIFLMINIKGLFAMTPDKKTIVLIHAFPSDKSMWEPQQTGLKDYFNVLALDIIGFGSNRDNVDSADGQAITMDEYADQVKKFLDDQKINAAIIGGESMGGYITLAFLKKYPSMVQGLILSNTQATADTPEAKEKREASAKLVLEQGTDKFIEGLAKKMFSSQVDDSIINFTHNMFRSQSPQGIASALRGMALRPDSTPFLSNINVPTLIITSDQDNVIPPQKSEDMHQSIPGSTLVNIRGVGHLSNLESPEQWNQAVIGEFRN